jgi:hypothetical protein
MSFRLISPVAVDLGEGAGVVRAAEAGAARRACFFRLGLFALAQTFSGVIV